MMNNNDDIYCFYIRRYEFMSLSWSIGGIITGRKTKQMFLFGRSYYTIVFFSLFQTGEGVVKRQY